VRSNAKTKAPVSCADSSLFLSEVLDCSMNDQSGRFIWFLRHTSPRTLHGLAPHLIVYPIQPYNCNQNLWPRRINKYEAACKTARSLTYRQKRCPAVSHFRRTALIHLPRKRTQPEVKTYGPYCQFYFVGVHIPLQRWQPALVNIMLQLGGRLHFHNGFRARAQCGYYGVLLQGSLWPHAYSFGQPAAHCFPQQIFSEKPRHRRNREKVVY